MQDGICGSSSIRLGITSGVPSHQLSALLALQREEEPETDISLHEVSHDALLAGLREGRYTAGLTFESTMDAALDSQPLWHEALAVAMPMRYPLLDKATLALDDLLKHPVFRWQVEPCPLLDQQMAVNASKHPPNIQFVPSFELMALWVAAGYGIGITAQSRLASAHAWGICMRPFADAPYEIVTHLLPSSRGTDPVYLRFARRAQQVAKTLRL